MDTSKRKTTWKRLRFWGGVLLALVVGIGILAYVTYRKSLGPPPTPPGKSPEFDQHLAEIDKDWLFLFWEPTRLVICDIYGDEKKTLVELDKDSGQRIDEHSVEWEFSQDASRFLLLYAVSGKKRGYGNSLAGKAILVDTTDLTVRGIPRPAERDWDSRHWDFSPDGSRLFLGINSIELLGMKDMFRIGVKTRSFLLDIEDWEFREVVLPMKAGQTVAAQYWLDDESFLIRCAKKPKPVTSGYGFGSSPFPGGFGSTRPFGTPDPFYDSEAESLLEERYRTLVRAFRGVIRERPNVGNTSWYRFSIYDLSRAERLGLPAEIQDMEWFSKKPFLYNSNTDTVLFRDYYWSELSCDGALAYDKNGLRPATRDERRRFQEWYWYSNNEGLVWSRSDHRGLYLDCPSPSEGPRIDVAVARRSPMLERFLDMVGTERETRLDLRVKRKLIRRTRSERVCPYTWASMWEDGVRLLCWAETKIHNGEEEDAIPFSTYYSDDKGRYRVWRRGLYIGKYPRAHDKSRGEEAEE